MTYTISQGGTCGDGQWAVLDASGTQVGPCYASQADAQTACDALNAGGTESQNAADRPAEWHAWVLPGDVPSSDGREFAADGGGWRDLPLPQMLMTANDWGHDGARFAGNATTMEWRDGLIYAEGTYAQTPEGEELRGYVDRGELRWVSADVVDVGDSELYELLPDGTELPFEPSMDMLFFADEGHRKASANGHRRRLAVDPGNDRHALGPTGKTVSDKAWDGSASRFTDEEYEMACAACDSGDEPPKTRCFLPHHEPGGSINRAGVHAAAQRFGSLKSHDADAKDTAASHLRSHYKNDLKEDAPDSIANAAPSVPLHDIAEEEQHGRIIERYLTWKIGGLTVLPFPAFPQCVIAPINVPLPDAAAAGEDAAKGLGMATPKTALAASVTAPVAPPAAWFANPEFGPVGEDPRLVYDASQELWACPLTVLPSGQVFGHLAPWEECYLGYEGVCMSAPPSHTDYAYFLTGEIETAEGDMLPCGQITLAGGHPDLAHGYERAQAAYADTRSAVCDVNCGQDEIGIWLAGALRPGVTDADLRTLRASALSGDWRPIGTGLELIAAVCVNSPGFPIPRRMAHVAAAGGRKRQTALVAAGTATMTRLRHRAAVDNVLETRLQGIERSIGVLDARTAPLRPLAASAIRDEMRRG